MTSPDPSAAATAAHDTFEPCEVLEPEHQTAAVVFASPHSGRHYPAGFMAMSRLDPLTVRRSEDAFVDEIFIHAPDFGAPLLRAHFPRAFVDPNREPMELDPAMFADPLPPEANTTSPRVAAGLGTIARVVTSGQDIYREKLRYDEVRRRLDTYYGTYHRTLRGLIDRTIEEFGVCLVVDCHSMPSIGGPMDLDPGLRRVDFVLGDCHGNACGPQVTGMARRTLDAMGFVVRHNSPYAGGFTTAHYGRPREQVHALQVEVNRVLYMNERTMERAPGLARMAAAADRLIEALVSLRLPGRR